METATKRDLPALTALWQQCFGDPEAAVSGFWKRMFDTIRVYVHREKGAVAAMACALPVTLFDEEGEPHSCAYFYAVCTHPAHRGKGICTRLLAYAEQQEARLGAAFGALVPEGADKFAFYGKRGYRTVFRHSCHSVMAAAGKVKIGQIGAEDYDNLRQMQLYGSFLSYDHPYLQVQEDNSRHSGGGLFRLETEDVVCCAAAERRGDTLCIKEMLPYDEEAAAALAARLGCKGAEVRTDGSDLPFGMLKALKKQPLPENAYLGLALD